MLTTLVKKPLTAIIRNTVGNGLAAKQDAVANQARMAELIQLRAERPDPLSKPDFIRVAETYDVDPWKLHAIALQEAPNGSGFDADGRLIAVPELHKWTERTAHAYDLKYPEFRQDKYIDPSLVGKNHPYRIKYDNSSRRANEARWGEYIAPMAAIDFDRALESTSWGAFQFMGFNWRKLVRPVFDDVFDVVKYLYTSQRAQLDVAVRLLIADGGFEPLRRDNWTAFAKVQNGTRRPVAYGAEVKAKADILKRQYT